MSISKEIETAIKNANKEENRQLMIELIKGLQSVGINISMEHHTPDTGLTKVLVIENTTAPTKIYKAAFGWEVMSRSLLFNIGWNCYPYYDKNDKEGVKNGKL